MNAARECVLGTRVGVADRFWLRLRGLLGRPPLQAGEGLMLSPCSAVHMHGMRYALDVAFLSRDGTVMALYHALPPGGKSRWHRGARYALELPAGTLAAAGIREGDLLEWTSAADAPHPTSSESLQDEHHPRAHAGV